MKISVFAFSFLSVLLSGCSMFMGGPAPAGVDVTNNLEGKTVVLSSTRQSGAMVTLRTGETYHVPICGLPQGSQFTITAKVFDMGNRYIGSAEYRGSVWFDSGGRYNTTWTVDSFSRTNPY